MLDQANRIFLQKNLPFWERLSKNDVEDLCSHTKLIKYNKGDNIYSAVKECIGVLLIKSGELRTYIMSEDGREITLYRLEENSVCILSASCLLKNITFDVSIDAEKDSQVLLINSGLFERLQTEYEFVENFALKIATDRFSDVMWTMEQILFMSIDRRLAGFLVEESIKSIDNKLSVTHEKIAQYMGSAREVVSRMLKYFEKEGLVTLTRGKIELIDIDGLKALI